MPESTPTDAARKRYEKPAVTVLGSMTTLTGIAVSSPKYSPNF